MSVAQETEYRPVTAAADMSDEAAFRYTFVSIGPSNSKNGYEQGNVACTPYKTGTRAYGILLNAPQQDGAATVRIRGGEMVRCGQAWTAGDLLAPMDNGLCGPTTDASKARGQATNSAVIGDIAMIELF